MFSTLAFTIADLSWPIAGLIFLVCLFAMGPGDVFRFSPSRIWAISGVCFRESIRRRVLWLVPLAIVATLVVCQFQHSMDNRDAVTATAKAFLFATGLIVTLSCILLACTNLPREIENRVIYTVVTKPTTRLELIIGKIVGFARVSAVVLIIMGLFTYGYVKIQSIQRMGDIRSRLSVDTSMTGAERDILNHYVKTGLLASRSYNNSDNLEFFARPPSDKSPLRSIYGGGDQDFLIPFAVDRDKLFASPQGGTSPIAGAGQNGLIIGVRVAWRWLSPPSEAQKNDALPALVPQGPGITSVVTPPAITLELMDENGYRTAETDRMRDPMRPRDDKARPTLLPLSPAAELSAIKDPDNAPPIYAYLPGPAAAALYHMDHFFIKVTANLDNAEIIAGARPGFVTVSPFPPLPGDVAPAGQRIEQNLVIWNFRPPIFQGRQSVNGGEEIKGTDPTISPNTPVAVYHFQSVDLPSDGFLPVELKAGIERNGGELQTERDDPTIVSLMFHDPATDNTSDPVQVSVENVRTAFASVPTAGFTGRDFDIFVRCDSPGRYLSMDPTALSIITGYEPFWWNLAKSLFILWMLTVLVITISIFSSTFLSWPIAVVFTIVLLLGHWGVNQLSDINGTELGRQISTDMALTDPRQVMVVTQSVNALNSGLNVLAIALPDVDQFAYIQNLEQGVVVSASTLVGALGVLTMFGLPIAAASYLILKNKEVAP